MIATNMAAASVPARPPPPSTTITKAFRVNSEPMNG